MAANLSLLSSSSIATETIPTTWIGSPRISFSQDLRQQDEEDGGEKRERLDEFSDFDFCVTGDGCAHEPSTADQLFSDGKILPIPIQTQDRRPTTIWVPPTTTAVTLDKGRKKTTVTADDEEHDKSTKTAFWKFGRSSSLNCGGSGSRGGGGNMSNILCSSLTLLSRSKSTGSNLNSSSSTMQKQQQQRKNNGHKASSSSRGKLPKMNYGASSSSYYYASCQGYYGNNGVRISPVLNVPNMPRGSGGANGFFGFGHLLCSGKNSRKKHMLTPATQPS